MNSQILASIDIGANSIRMTIAQVKDQKLVILEKMINPLRLGKDTFIKGFISSQTLSETIRILNGFKQKIDEYQIKNYKIVATSAVREANNKEFFLEQVRLKTGFQVEIVERSEEERIIFLALKENNPLFRKRSKKSIMLAKVGSGNVELSMMKKGEIIFSRSMPIGGLRLREQLKGIPESHFPEAMESYIDSDVKMFIENMPELDADYFIGAGTLLHTIYVQTRSTKNFIKKEDLIFFYKEIRPLSISQLVKKYELPLESAELLLPTAYTYLKFLQLSKAKGIIFENVSFTESLLMEKAGLLKEKNLSKKIWRAAVLIGEKYQFDKEHALQITKIGLQLFDKLKSYHNLSQRHRFLFKLACLWHDIGFFINNSGHHKHSYYLISNLEIPGLSSSDIRIIAVVARYHRKSMPKKYHPEYESLSIRDKVLVTKLASLLRIADALDRSHAQVIKNISLVEKDNQLQIRAEFRQEGWLEKLYFEKKKDLFERIFGISIELVEVMQ